MRIESHLYQLSFTQFILITYFPRHVNSRRIFGRISQCSASLCECYTSVCFLLLSFRFCETEIIPCRRVVIFDVLDLLAAFRFPIGMKTGQIFLSLLKLVRSVWWDKETTEMIVAFCKQLSQVTKTCSRVIQGYSIRDVLSWTWTYNLAVWRSLKTQPFFLLNFTTRAYDRWSHCAECF